MTKSAFRCLFALALLLVACTSPNPSPTTNPPATNTPSQEQHFIVFGDISDDPAEVIEGTQPIADYMAAKLAAYGITGGHVKVVASTEEMIELLKRGEVDVYFDSTYPATLISDASGAQIILRRWRFGVETYNSVIFASKASGITSIEGLKGKMIAMDTPYSTSGFMLPAVYLTENGLKLIGKSESTATVDSNEVGFAFAYDDENILQWVLSGHTPAGVTDDYNFDHAFPPEATAQLVELARTESTPRQVGLARAGLEPELLQAIVQILTTMHEDPNSQTALEKFQTTRFDEFPEGIEAATGRMREMMEIVKDIPLP
ncbi:MAG TPA: phosphate/phosphite/phosphonate ABC transporter substrate-binding protein [Anaerolineales bacterium]|nr:phosphate/phosphite/phosphonate ABC transporter substrate-binding protein [Anaerolineales bacterium]HNA54387.1 phosphate/phosphite/phosphonate ABC transporter substrate-binding protein [Anaerolineales bacterium]HNE68450.1 phosphate/phosphite/phosphonate ABC transporter substrate-binding protein [Anaerolineales bacterium]